LAETVDEVKALGGEARHQRVDVAVRDEMFAWADQVVEDHGKVNLIFNNAGVALGSPIATMSYDDFEWLFNINFWGVVHGTKAFLPHLEATGEGHIVNTSSVFGFVGVPSQSAYNAAKFAVRGFTEALRQELDLMDIGVSATSVHPGGIKTNIARDARMDPGVERLGLDASDSSAEFEKAFITTPEKAAKVILKGVERNKRRVLIGPDAYVIDEMARLMPSSYQRLITTGAKLGSRLRRRQNK
jgi:short-subunit dehydrogenase